MDSTATATVLETDRSQPLGDLIEVHEQVVAATSDTVVLRVERFGLAANNLSYVLFADFLRSWDAFPSPHAGRGRVPVWGVAQVLAADSAIIPVGARLAGYLPMATHLAVRAIPAGTGLLCTDSPRAQMLPIYRQLTRVADEPGEHADLETVLLPVTSFAALLADELVRGSAQTVVVSSASSRSAASLAHLLRDSNLAVLGLTSARHRSTVATWGIYDRVITYDEVSDLPTGGTAVYVDLAGAEDVAHAVYRRLGSALSSHVVVGGTHLRDAPAAGTDGPPVPVMVFNTGDSELTFVERNGATALAELHQRAGDELVAWAASWLQIREVAGLAGAAHVWRDIVAGRSDPRTAVVIRP